MSNSLDTSKASGQHHQLAKLTGSWQGTSTVWFEPENFADQSPVTGTMRLLLDGRFVVHEYKSSFGDKPLEGLAIYGYHIESGKFQSAWIDSFHNGTALMFSESSKNTDRLSVLGSYAYITPETEQKWGWRTEIDLINDNELKITAYNISPEGEEAKATEIHYTRSAD